MNDSGDSHSQHDHAQHTSDSPPDPSNSGRGHSHAHSHSGSHGSSSGSASAQAHGMAHGHSHAWNSSQHNIRFAFFLNLFFSLFELVGGIWIGSFAIMANAIHDVGDATSLGIAWFLEGYANQTSDESFNFGYRRFSLLSALVAGIIIAAGNVLILFECASKVFGLLNRSASTIPPQSTEMILIALVGLGMNAWAAYRLSLGQTQNERILTWHSIEDILGWTAVLIGGIILHFVRLPWLDPVLAMCLALFVTYNILIHLRETVYLFLQRRPGSFDEVHFVQQVLGVAGIDHIDHLAVWSLDGESAVLSARLHIHSSHEPRQIELIKDQVRSFAEKQNTKATLETCLMEKSDGKGNLC